MFDTDTLIILVICFSSKPKTEELVKSLILSGDYLPTSETLTLELWTVTVTVNTEEIFQNQHEQQIEISKTESWFWDND